MTFEAALQATEVLLALALLQQSVEHMALHRDERLLFVPRLSLAVLLLADIQAIWVLLGLCAHSVAMLFRFQGPYNGGSDRMATLVLFCLTLAHWLPENWQELAFGYLALQLVLSYFVSGQVKLVHPDWRSGQALCDVLRFSAYPVAETLRTLSDRPRLLWAASWTVILFEVLFPLALLNSHLLTIALCIGVMFHLANAFLFGLNRFVWAWLAAYPSILWFQGRVLSGF